MIRSCTAEDAPEIFAVINDSAEAYRGIIPADRWHEPYMPLDRLEQELADDVQFWAYEQDGEIVGVMGLQPRADVDLIRHAYVRSTRRKQGIGEKLLTYLESRTARPILIGTWAAASWAISFYQKNGYHVLPADETRRVLRKYWNIPERQIDTSVVLANARWTGHAGA